VKEKLTGKLLSALHITGNEYEVHDTIVTGLYVRVTAAGAKSYIVRWGRARKKTLGRVGILTLDQARQEATLYLYEARKHGEPPEVTQSRKGTALPSLRAFIDDIYMPWFKTHHKGYEKLCTPWTTTSIRSWLSGLTQSLDATSTRSVPRGCRQATCRRPSTARWDQSAACLAEQ
jgi:hypothetical protein